MIFEGILGVIVLILWVVALIDVWTKPRGIGAKVIWTLVILLLPIIGVILYFLFGR